MKGFYSIFAALCLTAYTNASPALPLFSIVKFENAACNTGANNNRMGTCYTKEECSNLKGKATSTCAEGFGTCCEFSSIACGTTTSQNNSFLINPATVSTCSYEVCPMSSNICRIKFQFDALTLVSQTTGEVKATSTNANTLATSIGACNSDSFSISGGSGTASPIICGTNTGQHMIMDSDGDPGTCNTVNINIDSATTSTRSWNIAVTQYECNDMQLLENTAGPKGCLQYHLGDRSATTGALETTATGVGRIDNFGYPGTGTWPTAITATVTHLQNQNYNICIRRHKQLTKICYTVAPSASISVSNQAGFGLSNVGPAVTTSTASKGNIDTLCTSDYISIPGGAKASSPTIAAFKFCGRFLSNTQAATANVVVCSSVQPFVIGVHTDGNEVVAASANANLAETAVHPGGIVGFHLTFAQS